MDSGVDMKETPVVLHHMERWRLLNTWVFVVKALASQQWADILRVRTGHMLLDVLFFYGGSHRLQYVHGGPRLPQREVVPHIITDMPKAGFTARPSRVISTLNHLKPRDQCQILWNSSPSPASWVSARKLAANGKDASATSVVQSTFRSGWWKDLLVVMNKHVVESCQCFLCQPFEDYAELVHTVQVII